MDLSRIAFWRVNAFFAMEAGYSLRPKAFFARNDPIAPLQ